VKTVIKETNVYAERLCFLNQMTERTYVSVKPFERLNSDNLQIIKKEKGTLIIGFCDGLKHHKYDDLNKLQSFLKEGVEVRYMFGIDNLELSEITEIEREELASKGISVHYDLHNWGHKVNVNKPWVRNLIRRTCESEGIKTVLYDDGIKFFSHKEFLIKQLKELYQRTKTSVTRGKLTTKPYETKEVQLDEMHSLKQDYPDIMDFEPVCRQRKWDRMIIKEMFHEEQSMTIQQWIAESMHEGALLRHVTGYELGPAEDFGGAKDKPSFINWNGEDLITKEKTERRARKENRFVDMMWQASAKENKTGKTATLLNSKHTELIPLLLGMGVDNLTFVDQFNLGKEEQQLELLDEEMPQASVLAQSHNFTIPETVSDKVIDFWTDYDLTHLNFLSRPSDSSISLILKGWADRIIEEKKTTLTKFPIKARPVLTKIVHGLTNTVNLVLGSQLKIQQISWDPKEMAREVATTYFTNETKQQYFKENRITIQSEAIRAWLNERPDGIAVDAELSKILEEGLEVNQLNKINIHCKLESLLKANPIEMIEEQKIRIICWQRKGICAIFSATFVEAKRRFKEILGNQFIYADGLTITDLSKRLKLCGNLDDCHMFEDDLAKQDRQTTHSVLDYEMLMYDFIGVDQNLIRLWRSVHNKWWFSNKHVKGSMDAMRLTGQATTALGNWLVNLLVHCELIRRNKHNIIITLKLGDDHLTISRQPMQGVPEYKKRCGLKFNMVCTDESKHGFGTFCQMVVFLHNGRLQIGPDYIRLRNRFEVTNGVHEANSENLLSRCMSYACMLGNCKPVRELVKQENWPIELQLWYDEMGLIEALEKKYNLNADGVLSNLMCLCKMLQERNTTTHKFLVLSEKK
jgi:hypothetical protein